MTSGSSSSIVLLRFLVVEPLLEDNYDILFESYLICDILRFKGEGSSYYELSKVNLLDKLTDCFLTTLLTPLVLTICVIN